MIVSEECLLISNNYTQWDLLYGFIYKNDLMFDCETTNRLPWAFFAKKLDIFVDFSNSRKKNMTVLA